MAGASAAPFDCQASGPGPGFPSATTASDVLSAIQSVQPMRSRFLTTLGQNQTDLEDIAAYLAAANGVASGPDLNQHGLTGSWYEPATSGQGIEVEVFPNLVEPGTGYV